MNDPFDWKNYKPVINMADIEKARRNAYQATRHVNEQRKRGIEPSSPYANSPDGLPQDYATEMPEYRCAGKCQYAQPEQEPVANIRIWHKNEEQHAELWNWDKGIETLPDGYYDLYTTPPQRKPLTVVEIMREWRTANDSVVDFARAIEAAHGIKENT